MPAHRVANKRRTVTAKLAPPIIAALQRLAARDGTTVSSEINALLQEHLRGLGELPSNGSRPSSVGPGE